MEVEILKRAAAYFARENVRRQHRCLGGLPGGSVNVVRARRGSSAPHLPLPNGPRGKGTVHQAALYAVLYAVWPNHGPDPVNILEPKTDSSGPHLPGFTPNLITESFLSLSTPNHALHDGSTDAGAHRPGTETRSDTETKAAFKTTEFAVYLVAVVGVLVASALVGDSDGRGDVFLADKAWLYITLLTIGYMISRGLAKAGSRARRDA